MAEEVAAAATAIAAAIRGVAPTAVPQRVNLQPFSGGPLEDIRIFREQLAQLNLHKYQQLDALVTLNYTSKAVL